MISDNSITSRFPSDQLVGRRMFTDQQIYEEELEKIFSRTWQYVGHESELKEAGSYKVVKIAGQSQILSKDRDGQIHLFANTCRHRGATLVRGQQGVCKGKVFHCLYHGWTYDMKGRLTGVPNSDGYGSNFKREDFGLVEARAESVAGLIFACLDESAPSLREYLGPAAAHLERICKDTEVVGYIKFLYRANWKFWQENFAGDGYHAPYLHRIFGTGFLANYTNEGNISTDLGNGHTAMTFDPLTIKDVNLSKLTTGLGVEVDEEMIKRMGIITSTPVECETLMGVFPNFVVADVVNVTSIQRQTPLAPDKTLAEISILGKVGELKEVRDQVRLPSSGIFGPGGRVAVDDYTAFEKCQEGMSVKAVPFSIIARGPDEKGSGIVLNELLIRAFYQRWRHYMGRSDC